MTDYYIRPASNAAPNQNPVVGAAQSWDAVNDPKSTPDQDASYIKLAIAGNVDAWGLEPSDIALIPPAEEIVSVSPFSLVSGPGGDPEVNGTLFSMGLRLGGSELYGTALQSIAQDPYTDFNFDPQTTDPLRGLAWSRGFLYSTRLLIRTDTPAQTIPASRCTQALVKVTTQAGRSKLRSILSEIVGLLSQTSVVTLGVGNDLMGWWELPEGKVPACYVVLPEEAKMRSPMRSKEGTAVFALATCIREGNGLEPFLDFYQEVEAKIEADPSLGGLALDSVVQGFAGLTTSATIAGKVHVADILLAVTYRHTMGAP
jgi:hypothetical protein